MTLGIWDTMPIIFVFAGIVLFTAIMFELGHQLGNYARSHFERNSDTSPGPMVAGIMTMLAFILALTFSMAASRFDNRKQLVMEEVNVIGTTYLRADFLDQPYRSEMKQILRDYVDLRLKVAEDKQIQSGIEQSLALQDNLWSLVVSVTKDEPDLLDALLIQSINELIDVHDKRVNAALRNRIPGSIWTTLVAIIALSMLALGSQTGLVRSRRLIQVIPMVLAFSALVTVVVDLDRPSAIGFIEVSQQAMVDLRESMGRGAD